MADSQVLPANLIRFPCDTCGKVLGADPTMRSVRCPVCHLMNDVPEQELAVNALMQTVRIAAWDVPLSFEECLRCGVKLAVGAIPLTLLLVVAACVVVAFAKLIWHAG